jgi:hypothetical protein
MFKKPAPKLNRLMLASNSIASQISSTRFRKRQLPLKKKKQSLMIPYEGMA